MLTSRRGVITNDGGEDLSAKTLRLLGLLFLVAAAVIAVLNLRRTANLGMLWLNAPLLVIGLALMLAARRRN